MVKKTKSRGKCVAPLVLYIFFGCFLLVSILFLHSTSFPYGMNSCYICVLSTRSGERGRLSSKILEEKRKQSRENEVLVEGKDESLTTSSISLQWPYAIHCAMTFSIHHRHHPLSPPPPFTRHKILSCNV